MDIDDHPDMTYRISCSAKASGTQYWTVEASSEEEAIDKFEAGEGTFESEDLEVTEINAMVAEPIEE